MLEHLDNLSRQELINVALDLWKKHGSDYRSLLRDYYRLLEEKRDLIRTGKLRKTRLDAIKKTDLKRYPEIEFLDYNDEREAKYYINMLDSKIIADIILEIEDFTKSDLTQTLKAKVFDYKYQIRHCNDRKSIYGLDPGACKGKGRHSHRTQLSYTANLNVSEK